MKFAIYLKNFKNSLNLKEILKKRLVVEPGEDRVPQKDEDLPKEDPVGLPKEEEPEDLLPICQNICIRLTCLKISVKL